MTGYSLIFKVNNDWLLIPEVLQMSTNHATERPTCQSQTRTQIMYI